MAWTEERIAKLSALWDKGLSASQIAAELGEGVTRNAVIGKAHRLELKSRPSPVKGESTRAKKAVAKPKKKEEKKVVTLLDLTSTICKWPSGHPGDDDFQFCGKEANSALPYCEEHCAMAYQAQTPRKERMKKIAPIQRG
ncbi:MAG: hypothetical protein KAR62_03845 [Sphingomonadales bacterium]|nr:hypothetical protein [Sphingomonadales bacterium]